MDLFLVFICLEILKFMVDFIMFCFSFSSVYFHKWILILWGLIGQRCTNEFVSFLVLHVCPHLMEFTTPLFQCLCECTSNDEEEILSDLIWSFQQPNDYARIFYESGEAKAIMSKDCYEALRTCINDQDASIKEAKEHIKRKNAEYKANKMRFKRRVPRKREKVGAKLAEYNSD